MVQQKKVIAIFAALLLGLVVSSGSLNGQSQDSVQETTGGVRGVTPQTPPDAVDLHPHVCPGDPAGNLASSDCRFRTSIRTERFVSSSLTDQAALGAVFFGSIAQWQNSPREWNRNWAGLEDRIGSRYAQNMAKGLAELTVGSLLGDDPRHISYASDPLVPMQKRKTSVSPRVGHAFVDFLTVRRSSQDGAGRRIPNISLFAGAAASGFVGNAWYPPSQATTEQAGIRACYSLGTALFSSFYTEFKPEVGRLLGAIFKRRG